MRSSRRSPRRRSAPLLAVPAASDAAPPFVMKPTRLRDALVDAHDLATRRSSSHELEQLYEKLAEREQPPSLPARPWSVHDDALARTAVAAQVTALERQRQALPSDDVAALQALLQTETSGSSIAPNTGASAWYVLGKVVGKGTFGRVQVATHRVTGARVAIKSYVRATGAVVCSPLANPKRRIVGTAPPSDSDALEWKRVRQEAKLMASLRPHAGLINFIEAFETPTQLQLVMPFASGGSLCDVLKTQPQQRLREPHARRVFAQLCAAVDALHQQHIIHRDLKLENVLLDDQQHPRLVDFGFSQREVPSSSTSSGSCATPTARSVKNFCGTPSYMAPEVVSCKSYDGKRVDVWSLGVILFVLLCGKFPFQATTLHQLYQTIRASTATGLAFPASVSADAQHLVRSLLVVDPLKRLALAEVPCHAWMRPVAHDPIGRDRARVFESFLAWDAGLETVCDALARLYGLDADAVLSVVRGRGTSSSSWPRSNRLAALVWLTQLTAEQHVYAALVATSHAPAVAAVDVEEPPAYHEISPARDRTGPPPPSPRSRPRVAFSSETSSHKQQLEQLIGLVKQSLG